MRIALAVDGTRGDVHPMLALAGRLRAAGHTVVVCGPPDAQGDCDAHGIELRPMGVDARGFLEQEADAIARGRLGFAAAGQRYFLATVRRQFERLPEATSDVDIVFGAGLCFAGPSAAERHGIEYRFVTYCPVLLPSSEHAPFIIPTARTPRWVNRLLWAILVPALSGLVGIEINRHRRRLGLPKQRDLYRALLSERPILCADPALAPLPEDTDVSIDRIGYLSPAPGEPLPEKLEDFLGAGDPPVYLGFGSMTDPDPQATTRLIVDAVAHAGCRAIVSAGWAGLGEGPLPERIYRTGPVDHTRLFRRLSLVVHHGGAGTTTTAARAGIPQIVVPHGVDQYYWAGRAHSLGVAPQALPRTRLRADVLGDAIAATLENELAASRARELARQIQLEARGLPSPESLLE